MFFTISGYCISATADSHRRKSHGMRSYFWRRFRRIYPPFWVFLAFASVFIIVTDKTPQCRITDVHGINNPSTLSLSEWLGNITLTETWLHTVCGRDSRFVQGHAWTLCYEEQFYAVAGIALALSPRYFFPFMALVTVGTLAACCGLPRLGISPQGFFFDGNWIAFASGIWVYYLRNYAHIRSAIVCVALAVPPLVYILRHPGDGLLLENGRQHSGEAFLFVSVVFAGVLLALSRADGAISRSRLVRPFAWCGTMCYSIYLVHLPIVMSIAHLANYYGLQDKGAIVMFVIPVGVAASLLAAWPFHWFVERRFISLGTEQPGSVLVCDTALRASPQ